MQIIANNPLKLSDKLLEVSFKDTSIKIDLVSIFANAKLSLDSKDLYIEVNEIIKSKHCRFDRFRDWYRPNEAIQKYINFKNNRFLIGEDSPQLENIKKRFPKKNWFNDEWLDQPTPLIIVKRGRYGGTWIHHDLLLKFLASVDVSLEVEIYEKMSEIISRVQRVIVLREDTKTLFHPLTDTIKNIWIPNQKSENAKKWAYKHILDLANKKAIGMTSTQYKKAFNITDEKIKEDGKISIRDYMSDIELDRIKRVEEDINGLIKYGGIMDIETLTKRIMEIGA
jgi:hypothetical protein